MPMTSNVKKAAGALLSTGKKLYVEEDLNKRPNCIPHSKSVLKWYNDIVLFADGLPDSYPLKDEIKKTYFHRNTSPIFRQMLSYMESIFYDLSLDDYFENEKGRRNTIMTKREKEQLDTIEKMFESSKSVKLTIEDEQRMKDVLELLESRNVVKNMHADDMAIYYKVGSFEVFREWLADQEEAAANVAIDSPAKPHKEYDVFISHANKDKLDYVDGLFLAIKKLGIRIFYDTEEISWGDNFKDVILNGTAQSEFAIIVISNNFFGREWTEKELSEFLKRQNESGQKTILPLLHGITIEDLKAHYPELGDIQAIGSENKTPEMVTILLAKELIKRYKSA